MDPRKMIGRKANITEQSDKTPSWEEDEDVPIDERAHSSKIMRAFTETSS